MKSSGKRINVFVDEVFKKYRILIQLILMEFFSLLTSNFFQQYLFNLGFIIKIAAPSLQKRKLPKVFVNQRRSRAVHHQWIEN